MTLKQFVWQELEKKGYVLDQEIVRFTGRTDSLASAETYKTSYFSLKQYKAFFEPKLKGKKYTIEKVGRFYRLNIEEKVFYKITKDFKDFLCQKKNK
jgi:hypothetical protein